MQERNIKKSERTDEEPLLTSAMAAAFLGISPSTLWKWNKEDPDFPQPVRWAPHGRAVSRWRQADLAAWAARYDGGRGWRRSDLEAWAADRGEPTSRTGLFTELAKHIRDLTGQDSARHLVSGYLRSGGSVLELAEETGIPEYVLMEYLRVNSNANKDEGILVRLFFCAIEKVLCRERELVLEALEYSSRPDPKRRAVLEYDLKRLDEAHRLVFGQSLKDYLLSKEGVR
ncbi:hypothetical protein MQE22_04135 [Acidithiobacillus sp. YTS05]|nr:hypothetical protein MQE22_04135 [Acidithiobacillus sp. YTS05]